ncbi:hypothetical protein Tco_0313487 [Tanacetum coccineum]
MNVIGIIACYFSSQSKTTALFNRHRSLLEGERECENNPRSDKKDIRWQIQTVPAQTSYKTDDRCTYALRGLNIVKSNLLYNAQKIQKNPIFQISVDILKNTNFFQALTASANVPAIYLQQFWKTMSYNEKTGVYSCQLDEQWFDLSADLLRKALAITPVPVTQLTPFELPPTFDNVLDFVNELDT